MVVVFKHTSLNFGLDSIWLAQVKQEKPKIIPIKVIIGEQALEKNLVLLLFDCS